MARYVGNKILENVSGMDRYHQWIVEIFKGNYGNKILEVGSGLGNVTKFLKNEGDLVLSEIDDDYIKYLKKYYNLPTLKWDIQQVSSSQLRSYKFDTIFSSNVLEHIKDDQIALNNLNSLLVDNGVLLLYVPAGKSIIGKLDQDLGHFRRYEKSELIQKLHKSGFEVVSIRYYNILGYFAWWLVGKILNTSNPPASRYLAWAFSLINYPLLLLERTLNLPFGQNLAVVAKKV